MQRLSYPTETVFSKKITRNRSVLSFKDTPCRKPTISSYTYNSDDLVFSVVATLLQQTVHRLDDVVLRAPVTVVVAAVAAATDFAVFAAEKE